MSCWHGSRILGASIAGWRPVSRPAANLGSAGQVSDEHTRRRCAHHSCSSTSPIGMGMSAQQMGKGAPQVNGIGIGIALPSSLRRRQPACAVCCSASLALLSGVAALRSITAKGHGPCLARQCRYCRQGRRSIGHKHKHLAGCRARLRQGSFWLAHELSSHVALSPFTSGGTSVQTQVLHDTVARADLALKPRADPVQAVVMCVATVPAMAAAAQQR
jgi:hypothetical protein